MRPICSLLLPVALVALCGCSGSKWGFVRPSGSVPTANAYTPTAATLVSRLNANSQQLTSIECKELDLDAYQKGQAVPHLRAKMVCAKPKYFRMSASVVGNPQVDLGSNDREFWFWIAKADPPYLFHCNYEDLSRGTARLPFPFQPDWITEALGLGEYGPAEEYQVRDAGKVWQLVQETTSGTGMKVRKVTVISKDGQGHVVGHMLTDLNNRIIVSAQISEVQQPAPNVWIPKRITLTCPSEQIELKMRLSEVTVNQQLDQDRMARLFTRPILPNIQSYDLARGPDAAAGGGVRPAGGVQQR